MAAGDIYSAARLVDGVLVLGCSGGDTPIPDCCPYQAALYGILFSDSDLPQLFIAGELVSPSSGFYNLTISVDDYWELQILDELWVLKHFVEGLPVLVQSSPCLFGEFSTNVLNTFPSSLNFNYVSTVDPMDNGDIPLSRASDCLWIGPEFSFGSVIYDSENAKFTVTYNSAPGDKTSGNQDTPTGVYAIPGYDITVS
jgi:hypothetical protein